MRKSMTTLYNYSFHLQRSYSSLIRRRYNSLGANSYTHSVFISYRSSSFFPAKESRLFKSEAYTERKIQLRNQWIGKKLVGVSLLGYMVLLIASKVSIRQTVLVRIIIQILFRGGCNPMRVLLQWRNSSKCFLLNRFMSFSTADFYSGRIPRGQHSSKSFSSRNDWSTQKQLESRQPNES